MITQRSAAINKNVLTQIETLFVLRTTSPQDRKAIEAWVDYHGERRDVLATLPTLASGEAWVWSPTWLRAFERVRIRRRATFDSGSTPKALKGARKPATLADIDLGAVRKRFAASIERAKADDPKELKRQIADLERELAAAGKAAPAPEAQRVEVPVLTPEQEEWITEAARALDGIAGGLADCRKRLDAAQESYETADRLLRDIRVGVARLTAAPVPASRPNAGNNITGNVPTVPKRQAAQRVAASPDGTRHSGDVPSGAVGNGVGHRLLSALAQFGRIPHRRMAILAAVKLGGSTWRGGMAKIRAAGWVAEEGDLASITDAGLAALGNYDPLPTGAALIDYWRAQLGSKGATLRAFNAFVDAYPDALTAESLGEQIDAEPGGSTMRGALAKLRGLGLVVGLRAADELFE
jgi:hypothetical protein